MVWNACVEYNLPLMYASSAATYGMGEHGFADRHDLIEKLKTIKPLWRIQKRIRQMGFKSRE